MNKWIAEFELEDGDSMPEHMDLNFMGARLDFHCKPISNCIPIPKDATNGDVIKAMFPNAEYDYHEKSELVDAHVTVFINDCDTCQDYSMDWWNTPYKKESEG